MCIDKRTVREARGIRTRPERRGKEPRNLKGFDGRALTKVPPRKNTKLFSFGEEGAGEKDKKHERDKKGIKKIERKARGKVCDHDSKCAPALRSVLGLRDRTGETETDRTKKQEGGKDRKKEQGRGPSPEKHVADWGNSIGTAPNGRFLEREEEKRRNEEQGEGGVKRVKEVLE